VFLEQQRFLEHECVGLKAPVVFNGHPHPVLAPREEVSEEHLDGGRGHEQRLDPIEFSEHLWVFGLGAETRIGVCRQGVRQDFEAVDFA
jgi:hypothetical protein